MAVDEEPRRGLEGRLDTVLGREHEPRSCAIFPQKSLPLSGI